jgi:hypothetical protein
MQRTAVVFLVAMVACESRAPSPSPTPVPVSTAPADAAPAPVSRRISLQVEASTWRAGEEPFDVTPDLVRLLRAAGVDASGPASPDGALHVEVKETKGREYTDTFNNPVGAGTDIALTLTVRRAGVADRVVTFGAGSGSGTSGGLYDAALASLKSDPAYQGTGDLVAAALGVEAALPRLAPLLRSDVGTAVADLYERAAYLPPLRSDQAQLLVVQHRYEDCVALGKDAVPPLLAVIESRSGSEEDTTTIAQVLGRIGDPRAGRVLLDLAKVEAPWSKTSLVVALVTAVGTTGDASMIPELEQLAGSDKEQIASAARAAKASLQKPR